MSDTLSAMVRSAASALCNKVLSARKKDLHVTISLRPDTEISPEISSPGISSGNRAELHEAAIRLGESLASVPFAPMLKLNATIGGDGSLQVKTAVETFEVADCDIPEFFETFATKMIGAAKAAPGQDGPLHTYLVFWTFDGEKITSAVPAGTPRQAVAIFTAHMEASYNTDGLLSCIDEVSLVVDEQHWRP